MSSRSFTRRLQGAFSAFRLLPAAFCLLLASVSTGSAYSLEGASYPDGRIVMRISISPPAKALTDGRASLNVSATDALNAWNPYLQRVQFAPQTTGIVTPTDDDRVNSVFDTNTIYGDLFDQGVLAVTLLNYDGGKMMETDVLINNRYKFDSYRGPLRLNGATRTEDLYRILLHEFGHVLGLDHPDQDGQTVDAIMNSHISDLDHLTADDIAGAHKLYDQQAQVVKPTIILRAPAAASIAQDAAGALKFRIRRTGAVTGDSPAISVRYKLTGTGINGVNYKALTGRATIAAGHVQVRIKLRPQRGGITDGEPVTVTLTLVQDAAYKLSGAIGAEATVRITP